MTKRELKRIAQRAMKEQGIKASQKEITLLEASGDGHYILWSVGDQEYRYDVKYGLEICESLEEINARLERDMAETRKELLRERTRQSMDPEMYYEMLSAFGEGETIVNVITGERYYL